MTITKIVGGMVDISEDGHRGLVTDYYCSLCRHIHDGYKERTGVGRNLLIRKRRVVNRHAIDDAVEGINPTGTFQISVGATDTDKTRQAYRSINGGLIDAVNIQRTRARCFTGNKGQVDIFAGIVRNAEIQVHDTKERRAVFPCVVPLVKL